MEKKYSQEELNESMQCVALDLLLSMNNLNNITNIREVGVNSQYSCISLNINNRKSGILIFSQMYPKDYNAYIEDNIESLKIIAKKIFDVKTTDIYVVGAGLINNNVPEEEKGIFRIGSRYAVAYGEIQLISTPENENYGLSINNPIKLSMVSDEYYYIEHLKSKFGKIVNYERTGSCYCCENINKTLDEWEIIVEVSDNTTIPFIFKYNIFMDAYSLDYLNTTVDDIKETPIFFEWNEIG